MISNRVLSHVRRNIAYSACPFTLCRGFFTPKIVGTFYMQGYKAKEKTAIVPSVSKLSGHPDIIIAEFNKIKPSPTA